MSDQTNSTALVRWTLLPSKSWVGEEIKLLSSLYLN
ncbi:hypothetical protein FOPG_19345 [Fusarium oxysporum f. sp. conglutinans race 2 54008]|uniref:Uncharacterized protein n=1 Tax=Fusarium oxysporum f. sp. conglutinans race 2 54008 TaxID=1089457 RepID=X0GWW8_FUSOX|nr:hypothetical protein FOPG_19345 [Fusarium oxysporum f. sp. conglutinans race 2 54008]